MSGDYDGGTAELSTNLAGGVRPNGRGGDEGRERLRAKAREAISTGALPKGYPAALWGGRGTGLLCPICHEFVTSDELEYEVEFDARSNGLSSAVVHHLHMECFRAWELEREDGEPAAKEAAP